MRAADTTKSASLRVRQRLTEFFATLDLGAELAETMRSDQESLPPLLQEVFGSQEGLAKAAGEFSSLKGRFKDKPELVRLVEALLATDPAKFLMLTHLHRQLRFTNVELIHFLFDSSQLDNISYYEEIMRTDTQFGIVYRKLVGSTRWQGYISPAEAEVARLATLKKAVSAYLGPEDNCWNLWRSRIKTDHSVRTRIAAFVAHNEDLALLIEQGTVETALQRSLRTVNVEMVKKERGRYAQRRVREILSRNGFVEHNYGTQDLEELERSLQSVPEEKLPRLAYTAEVKWASAAKKFDFALIGRRRIGFVLEVNYFSTSMSKIREVLVHFKELKITCSDRYRLIYVTDGVGWLELAKDLRGMLEFEAQQVREDETPFLMNLRTFEQNLQRIKTVIQ